MLRTNRSLLKFILLSLITFGIYGLVVLCHVSEEINRVAAPRDGKSTMHFALIFFLLGPVTLGIAQLVWYHRISKRMGEELSARGIDYHMSAGTYWGWAFFGSLILIGPFVYFHKFLKSMNLINADFNAKSSVAKLEA